MLGLCAVVVAAIWQNTFFVDKILYLICMKIHYTKGLKPDLELGLRTVSLLASSQL
jgi:hypothetical protein